MLRLLSAALRGESVATVEGVRELVDSGVEPLSLISTFATLLTHIIAGAGRSHVHLQQPPPPPHSTESTTTTTTTPPHSCKLCLFV